MLYLVWFASRQKKPKEHENYRLSWSSVNFYHVNEHKQKNLSVQLSGPTTKLLRPISKLKNYKMQKASSMEWLPDWLAENSICVDFDPFALPFTRFSQRSSLLSVLLSAGT